MTPGRWQEITPSDFPWEREALDFLRERLPDTEPFRAWSNFEFIADDGSINEVDLLVVSLYRIYLVEIKSRPGRVGGDSGTWEWVHDGRTISEDNPLILANRKAKKLKSLLRKQQSLEKHRLPFVEPIIYLSATSLRCDLAGPARTGVYLRSDAGSGKRDDIVAVLSGEDVPDAGGRAPPRRTDRTLSKAIGRAMEKAGIRPSQSLRKVGDFVLGELLLETDVYQDFEAAHVQLEKSRRRVRLYPHALASSESAREERREAAEREFRLLDGVKHPGILGVENYIQHERGPALVFEHDPGTERLDHFLRRRGEALDVGQRLELVRQLAEALQYAHSRRLFHRALSPQTVLVTDPEGDSPGLKVYDWQAGRREASSEAGTRYTVDQTVHVGLAGDQQSVAYLAPELFSTGGFDDVRLDVFSLGAIAYHVFSGQTPATSAEELHDKLSDGRGLRISDVLDGASESLQVLIELSTDPSVEDRPASIGMFLQLLDGVEEELTAPEPEASVHPLDAGIGDRIEGGFVVRKRLGKGSTCVALLIERDGREAVLKVARDPSQNERIRHEGEVLRKIRHQHVVQLHETLEIGEHAALLLEKAGADSKSGTYTLAERLQEEGQLTLDLLQRFGDELLEVVDWLEKNGISHRDIKPDNIGVGETSGRALTLVLFDFSLSGAPAENIRAGTPPYLDPFLRLRKPARWDAYAERFAAAMTLYEMATGQLPTWGDGRSDASVLDVEVTLDSGLFDPAVRDALTAFFAKALARDVAIRFDNAEEMRRAWHRVFATIDLPTTETDHGETIDLDTALAHATEATPLSSLGLPARVLNALERMGAHTIEGLLELPRIRLYRNKGIGQRTVREIRDLADRIAQVFAERGERPATTVTTVEDDLPVEPGLYSVDLMAHRLIPRWRDERAGRTLRALLGLDEWPGLAIPWPAQTDVAEVLRVPVEDVRDTLDRARERWIRAEWMTALREDVARLIDKNAGVMTVGELADALLATRGSVSEAARRARLAEAVAYAALETETAREAARFVPYRGTHGTFVAATEALADHYTAASSERGRYAEDLGARADEVAASDPLLAPVRAIEALAEVPAPPDERAVPPERMLRLAVAASRGAALSSRQEIYPKGMAAVRALWLGAGSLLGPKALDVHQIQSRVASRYPEAEPVPDPPELDRLLEQAGLELHRDETTGTYRTRQRRPSYLSTTSTVHRASTSTGEAAADRPAIDDAWSFEERLRTAIERARFLALVVPPKRLHHAEREILGRFEVERVSLEARLLAHMREAARTAGASWELVLRSDAAAHDSRDWRNLNRLVARAVPAVERELRAAARPALLVHPGLLARYGHVELLGRLRDACDRGQSDVGYLILIPGDAQQTLPMIDETPLPVIHPTEWARIPEAWLANAHRARSGAA